MAVVLAIGEVDFPHGVCCDESGVDAAALPPQSRFSADLLMALAIARANRRAAESLFCLLQLEGKAQSVEAALDEAIPAPNVSAADRKATG